MRLRLLLARLFAGPRYQVVPRMMIHRNVTYTTGVSNPKYRWPDACL